MKNNNNYYKPYCSRYKLVYIFIVFSFLLIVQNIDAQEITDKDSKEITSKTKEILQDFNELINLLISPDTDEASSKELIADSYAKDNPDAIFLNGNVVIEDDINPDHFDYRTSSDVNVKTYLKNIDLFLEKDKETPIVFSDIRVSNVKLGGYLYVKIFFRSLFKVNHKEIKKTYASTERVADVRAELVDGKWKVYIVLVSFVKPEDLVNPNKNDVVITENTTINVAFSEEKSKDNVKEITSTDLFQKNINTGDSAVKVQNYTLALMAYQRAKAISHFDKTIDTKIQDAQKLQEEQIIFAKRKLEQEKQKNTIETKQKNIEENKETSKLESKEYSEDEIKEIEKQLIAQEKRDKIIFTLTDGNTNLLFIGINHDTKKVIGLGSDKNIRIWNANNGELITKTDITSNFSPTTVLKSANLSNNGSLLAIANQDESFIDILSIYDLNLNRIVNKFPIPPFPLQNIEFNVDGQKILLVFKNKLLQIFNAQTGSVEKVVNFDNYITKVIFSPLGSQIFVNTQSDFQIINIK